MNSSGLVLLPTIKRCSHISESEVELALCIPENLGFFKGHFEQLAIVPGVTQIHWAVYYMSHYLKQNCVVDANNSSLQRIQHSHGFYQMQAIKFKRLIFPNTSVQLSLQLADEGNKLYFRYYSADQEFSSGRLYFHAHE